MPAAPPILQTMKFSRGPHHSDGMPTPLRAGASRSSVAGRPRLRVVAEGNTAPVKPGAVTGERGAAKGEALVERENLTFERVYGTWFHDVTRWIRALGAPSSETEDLAQEIFLVVRRKLAQFDGGNLPGWLYRITQLTVRDHRRRAWFKHLFLRRRQVELDEMPHGKDGPHRQYEREEDRRTLHEILGRMSDKRRTTFVLFEVEGYSGEEIF
jgi:RNA polymerase sigma-70 factor (ECF subfamily)